MPPVSQAAAVVARQTRRQRRRPRTTTVSSAALPAPTLKTRGSRSDLRRGPDFSSSLDEGFHPFVLRLSKDKLTHREARCAPRKSIHASNGRSISQPFPTKERAGAIRPFEVAQLFA